MPKVIEVTDDIISIGLENGRMKEVLREECKFNPRLGDEVEIYESDDENRIIVVKKEPVYNTHPINNNIYNDNTYYVAKRGKKVDKLLYCLLALFFGYFGVHQFYAGNTKKGLLYLFFCWSYIPFILALIDFFKGLFKSTDMNGRILIEQK